MLLVKIITITLGITFPAGNVAIARGYLVVPSPSPSSLGINIIATTERPLGIPKIYLPTGP